jgi:predicted nucleic acid-binding Zn ribbon protein
MTRRDEPVPLRDAVAAVGKELGLPSPDALAALVAAWPEIIGTALAPHTRVRSVRAGECTIEVDGPVWATQIRYRTNEVLQRAEARVGGGVIHTIRVVVTPPRNAV